MKRRPRGDRRGARDVRTGKQIQAQSGGRGIAHASPRDVLRLWKGVLFFFFLTGGGVGGTSSTSGYSGSQ